MVLAKPLMEASAGHMPSAIQPAHAGTGTLHLRLRDGQRIAVPRDLSSITTYVLLEQEEWFEKEISFLRCFLKPGMTVIDIGASLGAYSLPMARAVDRVDASFPMSPAVKRGRSLKRAVCSMISPISKSSLRRSPIVLAAATLGLPGRANFALSTDPEAASPSKLPASIRKAEIVRGRQLIS